MSEAIPDYQFLEFYLLVTGRMEAEGLPAFFRELTESGQCRFQILGRLEQQPSRPARVSRPAGKKPVPTRNEDRLQQMTRGWSATDWNSRWIILVDDLESKNVANRPELFVQYSQLLKSALGQHRFWRTSVHFLVRMAEAYFFGDSENLNASPHIAGKLTAAMLQSILQHGGPDVEEISSPKARIKDLIPDYKERVHGSHLLGCVSLATVLSNPATCKSLRSLIKWCVTALREEITEKYQLVKGQLCSITSHQIETLKQNLN